MRFKRHLEIEQGLKQIDILGLINVIFLLLLFFMLASSFQTQAGINVRLPRAVTSEAVSPLNSQVVISPEGKVFLNGRMIEENQLRETLNARPGSRVLIKADRKAPLGKVIEVSDLCRDSGASQISIATQEQ